MTANELNLASFLLCVKIIAQVVASQKFYRAMSFLQSRGYRVVPINPNRQANTTWRDCVYQTRQYSKAYRQGGYISPS